MMNVKISILSLVLMAGATSLFADNNDKGIDYYKAGMYSYAKKALFETSRAERRTRRRPITIWARSMPPRT